MRWILLLFSFGHNAHAGDCIATPCSSAVNFSYDLVGSPDYRPDTWGLAGAQTKTVKFNPPAGYRVRVMRVYGDFMGWVRGTPDPDNGDKVVGKAVGALMGLSSTAPDGSKHMEGGGASDGCFLYIQDSSKGEKFRSPFDVDTQIGGLLEPDNVMSVKAAVWLNTVDRAVHLESSFVVVYQFQKTEGK